MSKKHMVVRNILVFTCKKGFFFFILLELRNSTLATFVTFLKNQGLYYCISYGYSNRSVEELLTFLYVLTHCNIQSNLSNKITIKLFTACVLTICPTLLKRLMQNAFMSLFKKKNKNYQLFCVMYMLCILENIYSRKVQVVCRSSCIIVRKCLPL